MPDALSNGIKPTRYVRRAACRAGLHTWRVLRCGLGFYDEQCIGCGKRRRAGWLSR